MTVGGVRDDVPEASPSEWAGTGTARPDLTVRLPTLIADLEQRRSDRVDDGDTSELMITVPVSHLLDVYRRLSSQPSIEQAKGVLMGAYHLDADQAFRVLTRFSQDGNIKIRELAQLLTDGQTTTQLSPHELLQTTRQPAV